MGLGRSEQETPLLAGGVRAAHPRPPEADRLLDMAYELEAMRAELKLQSQIERDLRLALAAEKQRSFDHYELAPVGYLEVDQLLQIRSANLTASKLLGVDRRTLLSKNLSGRFDAPSFHRLENAVEQVLSRGLVERLHEPVVARSGAVLHAFVSPSDELVLITLLEHQTERPGSSSAAVAEGELQAVLDALESGVATIDEKGTILSCNRRMASRSGERLMANCRARSFSLSSVAGARSPAMIHCCRVS